MSSIPRVAPRPFVYDVLSGLVQMCRGQIWFPQYSASHRQRVDRVGDGWWGYRRLGAVLVAGQEIGLGLVPHGGVGSGLDVEAVVIHQ